MVASILIINKTKDQKSNRLKARKRELSWLRNPSMLKYMMMESLSTLRKPGNLLWKNSSLKTRIQKKLLEVLRLSTRIWQLSLFQYKRNLTVVITYLRR
jgi:hypothetical protein